jgi:hypothetical protein
MYYIKTGWPTKCLGDILKPYFSRRDELSVEQECLIWGYRVVIPVKLKNTMFVPALCAYRQSA